jgi:hypothetical protein
LRFANREYGSVLERAFEGKHQPVARDASYGSWYYRSHMDGAGVHTCGMKGVALVAIGVFWFLALASLVYWVDHSRYGLGIDLPFPVTVRSVGSFLLSLTVIAGWLPTLAVGIYRIARNR